MPLILDDWLKYEAAKQKDTRAQRAPQVAAEAHRAQTVLDHPGWTMFLAKLDEHRRRVQGQVKALEHELCHGRGLPAERIYQVRADLAHADGWLNALDVACDLIPEIVKAGQEIAKG